MEKLYWGVTLTELNTLKKEASTHLLAVINRLLRLDNGDLDDLAEELFDEFA